MSEAKKKCNYLPFVMWMILLMFFVYQFIARSSFPTVLTEEYMKYFSLDAKGVGALVSCYYLVYTFVQIPVGIIVDRYSIRLIAAVAASLCAAGVMIFVATQYCYVAGFGQMLVGLGSAFAFIAVLKTISNWFPPEKKAVFISYTISIGSLGPVIFSPVVAKIVEKFDWRHIMMIFSLLGFVVAAIIWIVVRDKQSTETTAVPEEHIPLAKALKILLGSPQIWVLSFFIMMQYAPLSALADLWGTSFIKKLYSIDGATASSANSMMYLGLAVGSPFFAHLAVRMNSYKNPMILGIILSAAVFSIVQFVHVPLQAMFVLIFMIGFSCGAMLQYALATVGFPKAMLATVSGFINMSSMVSGVILMPSIGWLIDLSWDGKILDGIKIYSVTDYRVGFIAVLVALLMGVVLSFFVKDKSPTTD
ncbi:MAG: MFS transporter [Holosporaceae bacterium]|jgi:MFS family permease|nr:MFS transporter [Holosporaceae bacterium]